jgi:hypothetical protein
VWVLQKKEKYPLMMWLLLIFLFTNWLEGLAVEKTVAQHSLKIYPAAAIGRPENRRNRARVCCVACTVSFPFLVSDGHPLAQAYITSFAVAFSYVQEITAVQASKNCHFKT